MNNNRTGIFFLGFILTFLLITLSYAKDDCNEFLGTWCWDKHSNQSTFALTLYKKTNKYEGGYSSVAYGGNIIDENENAFNFKICEKNIITTKIKTSIRNKYGLIQLKIVKNKLEWTVLKNPNGEFYAPEKAILHKCSG